MTSMPPISLCEPPDLEFDSLLEAIFRQYGHDFRHYASKSLKRRVLNLMRAEDCDSMAGLRERLLSEPELMRRFVLAATVNVTSMFRDPDFFRVVRQQVLPFLATWPFIRIWVAGCSTGEEVYSLAIILTEEGLYDRCRLYGTDLNDSALEKARQGIFRLSQMKEYTGNYLKAGGCRSFSDYYTAAYGGAVFHRQLRRNLVLARHNLVTDAVFNEFHLILCRNVMIYFNSELKDRVHRLLFDSLATFGVLGLGEKENLEFSPCEKCYRPLDATLPLYQKIERG